MTSDDRLKLYESLACKIGNTPVWEISRIPIPNNNRILAKLEYKNPTGSHYDRVFVHLLRQLEETGRIDPQRHHLVETTSGNAGAAFAWLCRELGYSATVIVPEDLPFGRIEHIRRQGARIIKTRGDRFVKGCAERLAEMVRSREKPNAEHEYRFPNHSRKPGSADALGAIAEEVLAEADRPIDYYVAAVGNGISILGPGRILKQRCNTHIVAWDPIEAPVAFEKKYPGRYRDMLGLRPGELGHHHIYGVGVLGVEFPILDAAIFGGPEQQAIIDEVELLGDEEGFAKLSYAVQKGKASRSALEVAHDMPDLSLAHSALGKEEGLPVGYSSAGSLALALKLCESISECTILVIFYDDISKY